MSAGKPRDAGEATKPLAACDVWDAAAAAFYNRAKGGPADGAATAILTAWRREIEEAARADGYALGYREGVSDVLVWVSANCKQWVYNCIRDRFGGGAQNRKTPPTEVDGASDAGGDGG